MKHGMGQERARAFQFRRQRLARVRLDFGIGQPTAEHAPHRLDDVRRRGLVQRDAKGLLADAQVDVFRLRAGNDLVPLGAGLHGQRVEERL